MIGSKVAMIGALVGAVAVAGIACKFGYDWGARDTEKKADIVITAKNSDISTLNGDLGQCRVANANYHASVADQLKIIQADLQANLMRQTAADQKNALADRRMMDAAQKSAENSLAAREAILHAVNQCVRDGVPAEYIGLLNTILPQRDGEKPAGGDAVRGSQAGN
jgi:hypothetical protein